MNPLQVLQMFMNKGLSPQKIVTQLAGNNPVLTSLVQMANSGNSNSVENFARNMFKEKGRDFDKEFSEFKSRLL